MDSHSRPLGWNGLEEWTRLVTSTYTGLSMVVDQKADFSANLSLVRVGRLELSRVESGPVSNERSEEHLSGSPADDLLLSLKGSGSCVAEQYGRQAYLGEGDLVLYDTKSPYKLDFPEPYRELVLKIPRASLASRIMAPERLTAVKLSGGFPVARLAGSYLRELASEADGLPPAARDRLDSAILDIVALALTDVVGTQIDEYSEALVRAKTLMRTHIADSMLSAASIAGELNVSVRTLNRLFSREGETAMRWLLDERLMACYRALSEARTRSVTEVAIEYGFSDLSHFSRVFKEKFGVPPSEVRSGGMAVS